MNENVRLRIAAEVVAGQSPTGGVVLENLSELPFIQGCAEFGPLHPHPKRSCRTPNKYANAGDLLLSVRAPVGRLNMCNTRMGIGRGVAAIVPRKDDATSRFLFYAISSSVKDLQKSSTGSTYDAVSRNDINSLCIPFCSVEEQLLIVRYLDHAELRIAQAISAKESLLRLLNEREELTLLEAITQSAKPKTSNPQVDWLGEYPAHWPLLRLGAVLEEREETNEDNGIVQVLSLVRKRGVIKYEDKGNIGNKRSEDIRRYKIVRPNDIVLNSMNVIIGSVGLSQYTGSLSPVYYVLRARSNENSTAYFNTLFQIERFHSSLIRFGKGILAHRMRIPMIELKGVMLPVPPLNEQLEIVARADKATESLRLARAAIESEIALLKEYRTRLISDVVTGKIDVRAEAAKLEDLDPLELAAALAGTTAESSEDETDDD